MSDTDPQFTDYTPVEQPDPEDSVRQPIHVRFWVSLRTGVLSRLLPVWAISMVLSLVVVFMLESLLAEPVEPLVEPWTAGFYVIVVISFLCMYLNAALGLGYGVTLIPILLVMGFETTVIPALIVAQFLAEIAAGVSHQSAGNIDLTQSSPHLKVAMVLAGCAVVGAPLAVKLNVTLPETQTQLAIGVIVIMIGIVIFATMGRRFRFSWRKIIFLGLIASFAKGFSGGGYGPIVTGGQILCGVGGKQAVGVKALAEGFACLVIVMSFLASGQVHDLTLAFPLVIGAICSVPFSAYTVRRLGTKRVTTLIATVTIILGAAVVFKALRMIELF